MKKKSLFIEKTGIYIMPKERSIDIDEQIDFLFAEFLAQIKKTESKKCN